MGGTPQETRAGDFQVNDKIDNQYLINKIRSGGMGVVYIVTDEFSGKRYAVKSLRDELLTNPEAKRRFETEAKTWINLDHHENVVQAMLYRVIQDKPLLFLEYIEGIDLEHLLNRSQSWPMPQVVSWFIQICRGMNYAHTKRFPNGQIGIVHRDLKPANVMLTRDGVVKITDFGLAKVQDSVTGLTRENAGLGTLTYMPPEQIDGARDVDPRADVYSFGAMAYEILTGRPPFTGDSVTQLCAQIVSKAPTPVTRIRPEVPNDLDRVILKCLEKDKTSRYSTFSEIEAELARIASRMTAPTQFTLPAGATATSTELPPPAGSRATSAPSSGRISRVRTAAPSRVSSSSSLGDQRAIEAVVFIDMVASTGKANISDTMAMQLKEELNGLVSHHAEENGFLSMKGTGDGFMLTFPTSENAVLTSMAVLRELLTRNEAIPDVHRRIDLRVGMHYGEVLIDSNMDRQGSTCNFASRIEGVKPADFHQTRMGVSLDELMEENRIFCSEVVQAEVEGKPGIKTRLVGFFDLKGFPGRHRVFEVLWK